MQLCQIIVGHVNIISAKAHSDKVKQNKITGLVQTAQVYFGPVWHLMLSGFNRLRKHLPFGLNQTDVSDLKLA